ncbi:MAG: hypothetical protein NTZ87_02470 [Candidatus Nomurabacteria bacterium]|nr:hypothetical protein [Candidatus Nomurabacteria bacterium]
MKRIIAVLGVFGFFGLFLALVMGWRPGGPNVDEPVLKRTTTFTPRTNQTTSAVDPRTTAELKKAGFTGGFSTITVGSTNRK